MEIRFYDIAEECLLKFAVIISKHNGKWVFCKHKERTTYEIPGGHREVGEDITDTAKRELYEETGALDFTLRPVCVYSVTAPDNFDGVETFGMLYFADIKEFEKELHSEIEMIELFDELPENWTYPLIQPRLIEEFLRRESVETDCNSGEKMIETKRLLLRPFKESDAESVYECAKDPDVGPIAGWNPHKSIEESLAVIKNVLTGKYCYAICEKGTDKAIGAIELKLKGHTDMTERDDECELGYWLGKPYWGRGYMPEVARELLRYGFEELGMTTVWCGYYDGNFKSKRVQEKLGFVYHHTCNEVEVPMLNDIRIGHTNYMTREHWKSLYKK